MFLTGKMSDGRQSELLSVFKNDDFNNNNNICDKNVQIAFVRKFHQNINY